MALTYAQLVDHFRRTYGRSDYHAAALYKAFYGSAKWRLDQLPEYTQAHGLREKLHRELDTVHPTVVDRKDEEGVTRLVFRLRDGHTIETVVIPMANHSTVCISCQVGCRMGCRFCQTGQLGLIRNLSADEIVAQVYAVKVAMGLKVRNVVFMGMGEPLDNFEAVTQAIRVMEDQRGLDIAKRHITLSTAGLPHKIEQLARLNWPQLKLALSLNAPEDTLRTELMPINRHWPMDTLKKALATYPLGRGNAFFMEYVLIKDINDQPRHARQLADYFKNIPVKMNLIPYNPRQQSPYCAPADEDIRKFHQALIDQKIFVRLRSSKGAGIRASCGQLGGNKRTN